MTDRRLLDIDTQDLIPLAVGGAVGAVVLLIAQSNVAYADNCLQYVKTVKNFVSIPKNLLEDCMRTGSVQAIITAILASMGAGTAAVAVNKGLQSLPEPEIESESTPLVSKRDDKEKTDGGDVPETPGEPLAREKVSASCRVLFDKYQAALQEAHGQNQALQTVKRGYMDALTNHQSNLAKVTIQLGIDAADMASAGAGGVKGGLGVATAVSHIPEAIGELKNLINKAIQRSGHLGTMITGLAEDIAGLMTRGARFASAADEAGRLSAKAESKVADLVKEAALLEGQAKNYDELVRFARTADATLLERNAVSKSVLGAQEALAEAEQNHEKIIARKASLEEWAARKRMMTANDDARKFSAKHDELGSARSKIQAMQAKNAEAAKAAHAEWQAKMSELSAAKKELDEARATAAHLAKYKNNKILAEQEVRRAAGVVKEAETHLASAEAELQAFDDAERARYGATRPERIESARAALKDAKEASDAALARRKQAKQALAEYESIVNERDPDFWAMSGDELTEREALLNARNAAREHAAVSRQKAEEWRAANPGEPLPADLDSELHMAETNRMQADKELTAFNYQMENEGKGSPVPPEQAAELARLQATVNEAINEAAPLQARLDAAKAQLDAANIRTQNEIELGKPSGSDRSALNRKITTARQHVDQAAKVQADAEATLATRTQELAEADISGTGEPLDAQHRLDWAQPRYDALVQEQEALRIKYDQLKSGHFGNEVEAAAIQQRIDELESELGSWKDADWEAEAATTDPQRYSEWQSEQAGLDKIGESQSQISALQEKLKELQSHLATVERKLSEQQGQTGGKSTEQLEAEQAQVKADLQKMQTQLQNARDEQKAQQDALTTAENERRNNENEMRAKEAEKQRLEDEKRKADEEVTRHQEELRKQFEDVSSAGKVFGPLYGDKGSWTPYAGSDAEKLAKKSRSLREQFDQGVESVTPEWVKTLGGYIKTPFRWAGNKMGEGWHWAFGGQSPEEVVAAIKRGDERVKEWAKWLANAEEHATTALEQAKSLKRDLDACMAHNQ